MNWLEIVIETAPATIEAVAARLTAGGFADLVIEDQTEFEDFLQENRSCWDYIDEELQKQLVGLSRIRRYLEDTDTAGMEKLRKLLEKEGLSMSVSTMGETNWEESWKDNYPPQPVGDSLVVLPYWLENYETDRKRIILDPGLTFGTGAPPSTQMVMETMEEMGLATAVCLDLGSGSGILSITALRLGAKSAVGVDIDPKAEGIARENAAYNGFGAPEFTALTGNVTADKKLMDRLAEDRYDLVLVNIVADVIIGLSPVLPKFMDENTRRGCSGILDTRLSDVTKALEKAGLVVTKTKSKEDWRCVSAKRRIQ